MILDFRHGGSFTHYGVPASMILDPLILWLCACVSGSIPIDPYMISVNLIQYIPGSTHGSTPTLIL
jgi:hypothetical protein